MKNSFVLLFFCTFIIPFICHSQNSKNEITDWVDKNCIPIKYVTAENGLEDLKPLNNLIGDARIVSLGECTHGSSEIFSMKHRMLEYLVKEKGFTIFSIEANMPEAYALNDYIIYGKGNPKELLRGMYFWTWNTQEVLDMIEWMKKYNSTSSRKIIFTGFDMQTPYVAIEIVRHFITIHKPILLSSINNYYDLYFENAKINGSKISKIPELISLAQNIFNRIQQFDSARNDTGYLWALQNAKILLQYANMLNGKTSRDESMAENVKWILDQNPGAKMFIWAHNEHVRKEKNKWGRIGMGDYLNKYYGNSYICIASSTEEGTYTAIKTRNVKFGLDSANILIASNKKDIEYYLRQSKYEKFIIDLRKPVTSDYDFWKSKKMGMRNIGALTQERFQFFDSYLEREYDMILFIRNTTGSKNLGWAER